MGYVKHWQQALLLSALLHVALFVIFGWLSPLSSTAHALEEFNELIEMELTSSDFTDMEEWTPLASTPEPLLASTGGAGKSAGASPLSAAPVPALGKIAVSQGYEGNQENTSPQTGAQLGIGTDSGYEKGKDGSQVSAAGKGKAIRQRPQILQKIDPVYPEKARQQGLEGLVIVQLEVLATGLVGELSIKQSSGSSLLDTAALEAVRQWRFIPAKDTASGMSLSCVTTVPLAFQLN